MRHCPASQLPSTPAARFVALFATQPRWTREQLDPYLAGLKVRGVSVHGLFTANKRAAQPLVCCRSPAGAGPHCGDAAAEACPCQPAQSHRRHGRLRGTVKRAKGCLSVALS